MRFYYLAPFLGIMSKKSAILLDKLPKHIAIIMDGNGRWAKKKGMMRVFGHKTVSKQFVMLSKLVRN